MQASCSYFTLYKALLHQSFVFSENDNHTSLYGPIASGIIINPTLQVCLFSMLVSPIAVN
jgi:hypothetical protein